MLTVKFIRDANIPGAGYMSKNTKVNLTVAQAVFAVNHGYAVYLNPLVPETVQMVDKPMPLTEEPLVLTRHTQKTAPPLEPVGEPEDPEKGSRKRKKSKEG